MPGRLTFSEFEALPQWLRAQLLAISEEENIDPCSINMANFATAQMCANVAVTGYGNLAFEEAGGHEEGYDAYRKTCVEVMSVR